MLTAGMFMANKANAEQVGTATVTATEGLFWV